MRNLLILMALGISLVGCGGDMGGTPHEMATYGKWVSEEKLPDMRDWISKTLSGSSSEDADDALYAARNIAKDIFGERTLGMLVTHSYETYFIPYDQLNARQKAVCDEWVKAATK